MLKTGRWFHGKEIRFPNPAVEIEHLLTVPTQQKKPLSPKIVKTGFPASSVTKAQLADKNIVTKVMERNQMTCETIDSPLSTTKKVTFSNKSSSSMMPLLDDQQTKDEIFQV